MMPMNSAPAGFEPHQDLPSGFYDFYRGLHARFAATHRELVTARKVALAAAHAGRLPDYLPASEATTGDWRIALPSFITDQRNQMTGPADDGDLVVKMLNSGAPGVMIDLEDSMANSWSALMRGYANVEKALHGTLSYFDKKRQAEVTIKPSSTVLFTRVRGLHLHQAGVMPGEPTSASLFDLANVVWRADANKMKHPLCVYLPKSESAHEAHFWRDVLQALALHKGWAKDAIKCMALVESHPFAHQTEEFVYHLREHIIGLNLGRWDYMASLIHFNLEDPNWVLPDRNTIPHDIAFFQNLRELIPEVCHKRGIFAIGGMTALFPSRDNAELNQRALAALEKDKKNEAGCLFDGAWTGHPDQNEIAVKQFPEPNQLKARKPGASTRPNLRPLPTGVGTKTVAGTRAAVRTVIRYRHGVLNDRGASLLDGYMEDLATDRIYRLMIAQRMKHFVRVPIVDEQGTAVAHTPALITKLFDEELQRILAEQKPDENQSALWRAARVQSEELIKTGAADPV